MKHILCICLSSTIQRTVTFKSLTKTHVNRSEHYVEHASGKAINSARVLNQLEKGCATTICPLGINNADYFLNLAQKDALEIAYVLIPGNTRTCWTLLDKSDATTTELVVGEKELTGKEEIPQDAVSVEAAEIKILKLIHESLDSVDAVLLSGSKPKIWSTDLYAAIAGITKDHNKILLADYIGQDLELTLKSVTPDIIKINDTEFIQTFMKECGQNVSEDELKNEIICLSKKLNNIVVVTRGTQSTFAAQNGKFEECPVIKTQAVNTTACGDSFNSGFLYEFLNTKDFSASLKKGTWCASKNAKSEIPGNIL
ncbi:MAG: hypothetical protein J6X54_08115 [Treponema sp.]|nr:hypothetical protein [Treponema sp.]